MSAKHATQQLTTFYIEKDLFGIEVTRVQEVTGKPRIVPVPLAPSFVLGMVNLRGQIATALGMRTLFGHAEEVSADCMSVVCRLEGSTGNLVSLIVDSIGDVVEVTEKQFENAPETVPLTTRKLLKGIYKMDGSLLCILDLDKLSKELSRTETNESTPIRRAA
jgi:purine-binding chemotaxis protein CheW